VNHSIPPFQNKRTSWKQFFYKIIKKMNETHQRFDEHCDRMRFTGQLLSESAADEKIVKLKKDTKMRLQAAPMLQTTKFALQLRLPCVA
jgi:hypothetical protein